MYLYSWESWVWEDSLVDVLKCQMQYFITFVSFEYFLMVLAHYPHVVYSLCQ